MAAPIQDLWSEEIHVDVLTPVAILRAQQGLLQKKTKGIVDAKLTTTESKGTVIHQFDLLAPALKRYQESVLTATHGSDHVYPVTVKARCYEDNDAADPLTRLSARPGLRAGEREAGTEAEFITLIREVLQSKPVVSAIQSLIARSNEVLAASAPAGPGSSAH